MFTPYSVYTRELVATWAYISTILKTVRLQTNYAMWNNVFLSIGSCNMHPWFSILTITILFKHIYGTIISVNFLFSLTRGHWFRTTSKKSTCLWQDLIANNILENCTKHKSTVVFFPLTTTIDVGEKRNSVKFQGRTRARLGAWDFSERR